MATKITLKNAKFVETTFSDGSKQLIGTVRGDSFVNLDIPTKPNPRQFIGDANPNYKDMVKTLRSEPEMFARKNSAGITIFADAVDNNGDGSYTVTLKDGNGIANGGHTYHALKVAGTSRSQAKVTIEIGLDTDKSIEIATALNLSKKLQSYSLRDKAGAFDWHKKALGAEAAQVIYHEGDKGILEVKEAISFLNLFTYDLKTGKRDIHANIKQSDHGGQPMKLFTAEDEHSQKTITTVQYIAKDVHELTMSLLFDENIVTQLALFKKNLGQNWLKTRAGHKGMTKGLGILLVAGLVEIGTCLNKNGIVKWKGKYQNRENREKFLRALFDRVTVILPLNDGTVSSIVREPSFKENILTFSKVVDTEIA